MNDEHYFNHTRLRFKWASTDLKALFEENNKNPETVDVKAGFDKNET